MSARVVVVGGGVAGAAAAWSASAFADVTLVDGGVGATSLSSGAVDLEPWDRVERAARLLGQAPTARALPEATRAFIDALGLYVVPNDGPLPLVATTAGRVRSTRGHDRALLDLRSIVGRRVLLPRADRPGWDADGLARAFGAEAPRELELTFDAVDAVVLYFDDERRAGDAELASRHDEPERLAWLGRELARLAARKGGQVAALLGPWLGAVAPRAEELSRSLGFPVGEALSGPPGPSGMRFEAARDALLSARGVTTVRERVTAIHREGSVMRVALSDGPTIAATSVVLATGGLVGGGVLFDPPDHAARAGGASHAHAPYKLSLELDVRDPVAFVGGSIVGPVLDLTAWPRGDREGELEQIGIHCIEDAILPAVYAAGDLVAGRSRTVLEAIDAGTRAGRRAARIT